MSSPRDFAIALAGFGNWGQKLARAFGSVPGARIAWVADPSAEARAAARARAPDLACVADLDEALADDAVRAVVVATPPASHAELALRALAAQKDVFVEKPMALSLPDARELERAAREAGRRLMVGHILEFHPAVVALGEAIRRGELGRVRWLASRRLGPGSRRRESAWWSLAPHDVSVIRCLLGAEPARVRAFGWSERADGVLDVASARFDCDAGVTAWVHVSSLAPKKVRQLVVFGSERIAVFDDVATGPKLQLFDVSPGARVELAELAAAVAEREPATGRVPDPFAGLGRWVPAAGGRPVVLVAREPLMVEVEHFVEVVRGRAAPRSDAESGRHVVAALEAGQTSMSEEGRAVVIGERAPREAEISGSASGQWV